jgi:hypothetical protein
MDPISFTQVTLRDPFWAPRLETNRQATIPHVYDQCEQTGRLAAWDLTWKPGDPNPPHIFWDSDGPNGQAAAFAGRPPRSVLEARLDALIAKWPAWLRRLPELAFHPGRAAEALDQPARPARAVLRRAPGGSRRGALRSHRQPGAARRDERYADPLPASSGGRASAATRPREIELALVKLFHATGEVRYLRLADYFVDERGRSPHYYDQEARNRGEDPAAYYFKTYAYMQAHIPVREQTQVVGHAVRATYLYSALADLARETGDEELLRVGLRLWQHLSGRRLYVTGSISASAANGASPRL